MKNITATIFLLITLVLSIFTILPLFHSGFFPIHDNTQVARVFEMTKSLKDGMIPVRWVSDLGYGYGYPIFTFYAPFAYYIGGIIGLFLLPLVATKIMIATGMILSAAAMYLFARKLFGVYAGMIAGVFYSYAPYHAVDLYVRGDIAELWAYAWIPLAFYGFLRVFEEQSRKNILIASFGFAAVILSHNLTALMVTPFLAGFIILLILISHKKLHITYYMLLATLLALGLSSFYFLPVFYEMKYTNVLSQIGTGANFRDHFVCLSQLWQSPWGYGGSTKGCIDGFSFMIGKLQIFFACAAFFTLPFVWKKNKNIAGILILCIVSFLVSIFFMLQISQVVWNFLSFMAFFQYPWRFLLLTSFFSSLLAGGVISSLTVYRKINARIFFCIVVIVITALLTISTKYFIPQTYLSTTDSYYTSPQYLQWTASKISDEYMPRNFIKPSSLSQVPNTFFSLPSSSYVMFHQTTQEKKAQLTLSHQESIQVSLAYFPAWRLTIDGKKHNLSESSRGIKIMVPAGTHLVIIFYQSTLIELFANAISLASLLILILAIIRKHYVRQS